MKRGTLIEFLESISKFSETEKKIIYEHSEPRKIEKGGFLLEYGEICTNVNYIISGVIRFYILNEDGEELTTTFISEGEVATRIESFLRKIPSNGYLHCETTCELISISKESWDFLCEKVKNFGYTMGQLATLSVAKKLEMQRRLLTQDAHSAYQDFLKMHDNVSDRVPMKHIASYLGITASSLSRIKKEITGN